MLLAEEGAVRDRASPSPLDWQNRDGNSVSCLWLVTDLLTTLLPLRVYQHILWKDFADG